MPYYKFFLQVHLLLHLLFLPLSTSLESIEPNTIVKIFIPVKIYMMLLSVPSVLMCRFFQVIACRFFIHLLHFKCIEKGGHYFVCFNISLMIIIILPSS